MVPSIRDSARPPNTVARWVSWRHPARQSIWACKCVSFHFTQEARREMKRNLKRKHLSHDRTEGSVDHGKGAAAKFARGYCSEMERRLLQPKARFLIRRC